MCTWKDIYNCHKYKILFVCKHMKIQRLSVQQTFLNQLVMVKCMLFTIIIQWFMIRKHHITSIWNIGKANRLRNTHYMWKLLLITNTIRQRLYKNITCSKQKLLRSDVIDFNCVTESNLWQIVPVLWGLNIWITGVVQPIIIKERIELSTLNVKT